MFTQLSPFELLAIYREFPLEGRFYLSESVDSRLTVLRQMGAIKQKPFISKLRYIKYYQSIIMLRFWTFRILVFL